MQEKIIPIKIKAVICVLTILLSYASIAQNDSLRYPDKVSYQDGIKISDGYNITMFNLKVRKSLYDLIVNSREDFIHKYKRKPNVIVVNFIKDSIGTLLSIQSKAFMYVNEEEMLFMDEFFYGFLEIEETIVLFKDDFKNAKNLIEKKKEINVKIKYGSFIDFCIVEYRKERKKFTLINNYCSSDLGSVSD